LPPGNYLVFGINNNGVPSIGATVNIGGTSNNPNCLDNPCDDNGPCTINDAYDATCTCNGIFQDSDNDGTSLI